MKTRVQQIVEKWSNPKLGKLSVVSIEDEGQRVNCALLMEAQLTSDILSEASQATTFQGTGGSLAAGTIDGTESTTAFQFKPMALALVRRTFPELFAQKTVGVQPMKTPVGVAYALRVKYNDSYGHEAGWEQVARYGGYTGSQAYLSAALAGAGASTGVYDTSGIGASTSAAEGWTIGSTYPQLDVTMDQVTIRATTRKLAASYSLEGAQDLKLMHDIELEKLVVEALQYEIVAELDRELMYKLKTAATTAANGGATITAVNVSAFDGRWSQEKLASVANAIVHQSEQIALKTKRGAGNFVIVSSNVATALQITKGFFTGANDAGKVKMGQVGVKVGTVNGNIDVYRDQYAEVDYALVGLKTAQDWGVVYSPYITGVMNRAISDADFSPRIGVMSRYAITDSLLGSGRYYRLIPFTNLSSVIASA